MQGWVGAGGSGMERCPENANLLGLSLFCSSRTLKVLRGLNHFVVLKEKRWEAPKKRLNLLEVLGDCTPNPKDTGLSALWDSGTCKTLRGPNLLEAWKLYLTTSSLYHRR